MAPEYDPENLYTLTDQDGNQQTFELLDVMDVEDRRYFALTPFYGRPSGLHRASVCCVRIHGKLYALLFSLLLQALLPYGLSIYLC